MEPVRELEPDRERSPLAAARVHRQLTVDEAARRAGITPDQVRWLEEGRVYRFPSSDHALVAALLYSSALGIEHREARELAGLPVPPKPLERNSRGRLLALAVTLAAAAALVAAIVLPGQSSGVEPRPVPGATMKLPPPWRISVEVLNGSGDINHTRRVASRIGALAYTVTKVARADRFDYPQTAVYYETGGQPVAVRLARELGVITRPLPSGHNPRRLVVVVGPQRGPGE